MKYEIEVETTTGNWTTHSTAKTLVEAIDQSDMVHGRITKAGEIVSDWQGYCHCCGEGIDAENVEWQSGECYCLDCGHVEGVTIA